MSICYLMNPLQQQINLVLHELSHGLELPDYVLAHKTDPNAIIETHIDHSHYDDTFTHKHNLIDFINTIFQASNENNNSDDSQLTKTKWDKHISTYGLKLLPIFERPMAKNFCTPKPLLQQGHFERLGRPPQNLGG